MAETGKFTGTVYSKFEQEWNRLHADNERLEAENQRLREALEDLNISGTCTFCSANATAINGALGRDVWPALPDK